MTGPELAYAQRVLGTLRSRVDEGIASVVHQDVQGEGVQMDLPFDAPVFVRSIDAVLYWPEVGWPDHLEDSMKPVPADPEDPKNQAPGKHPS